MPCADGVHRGLGTDYIGAWTCVGDPADLKYLDTTQGGLYRPGECTHCHEPHSSFGGGEADPSAGDDEGPDPYLAFKEYGGGNSYAILCWECHENMSNINSSGSTLGYGRWGFYQGQGVYESSSHYNSSNFAWPGQPPAVPTDPVSIWPRLSRSDLPAGNTGSCLNCHTPHGIMESGTSTAFDKAAVPAIGNCPTVTNIHCADNNASVNVDYLIPRQLIAWEESLCENCHDSGGPATSDIQGDIDKRSSGGSGHPVDEITSPAPAGFAGRHVAGEPIPIEAPTTEKHVECYDCHNPHAATGEGSSGTVGDPDFNRMAGMAYIEIDGTSGDPAAGDREPYVYEICLKCHGETFDTFIEDDEFFPIRVAPLYPTTLQPERTSTGNPASSYTYGSNKRLEFDSTSTGSQAACSPFACGGADDCNPSPSDNTAYHPVAATGINTSTAIDNQLIGGLDSSNTINCTDCHNSEVTDATQGPVTESNLRTDDVTPGALPGPVGPHGSKPNAVGGYQTHRILRANYNTTLDDGAGGAPFLSYDRDNFALCFLCHDEDAFTCQPATESCGWNITDDDLPGDPTESKTNFASTPYNANLHASHIAGKPAINFGTYTTCANCHYNLHSNVEAVNTAYEDCEYDDWERTADGSRLINFSPIVGVSTPSAGAGYNEPFWGCVFWLNEWRKGCDFNCHGFDQQLVYTSPNVSTSCPYPDP